MEEVEITETTTTTTTTKITKTTTEEVVVIERGPIDFDELDRKYESCSEEVLRNRQPPGRDSILSFLFYGKGPLGPQQRRLSWSEKLQAFWITSQMTDTAADKELRTQSLLSELIMFIIYIIILGIVTYHDKDPNSYLMTNSLQRQFTETKFPNAAGVGITFLEIKSAADAWNYLQKGLTRSLFWEKNYHPDHQGGPIVATDKNVLYENILIGLPRIRMLRVDEHSCSVFLAFRHQFFHCWDYYSQEAEDKNTIPNLQDETKNYYWYDGSRDDNEFYKSTFADYGKGGYSVYLPHSYSAAKLILQGMKESRWISRGTRVIFVDFSVFNTQVNLFCAVKLILEFPPNGGAFPKYLFKTTRLFQYETKWDYFIAGFELMFAVFCILHILEVFRNMAFFGLAYFSRFGSYVDLLQIILSFYAVGFLYYRSVTYRSGILKLIREKKYDFVNIDSFMYYQWLYSKITAILYFLALIKIFKYWHFTNRMTQITYVLSHCAKDIVGFLVMFACIFLCFCEVGCLMFGNLIIPFRTQLDSMYTLLKLMTGQFDYQKLARTDRVWGPIYFLAYFMFIFFLLTNMFLAIMNETYLDVTVGSRAGNIPERILFKEYMQRAWLNYKGLLGPSYLAIDRYRACLQIKEMTSLLLKHNFTMTEIRMLYAKYGIDGRMLLDHTYIRKILKDFDRKYLRPTEPPKVNELKLKSMHLAQSLTDRNMGPSGVAIRDYELLMLRLKDLEWRLNSMTDRVTALVERLDLAEIRLWSTKRYTKEKPRNVHEYCPPEFVTDHCFD